MGAEQSSEAPAVDPEEAAATKLQAVARGHGTRRKSGEGAKATPPLALEAERGKDEDSSDGTKTTNRSWTARFMSWRPGGGKFATGNQTKRKKGHNDPKKVFEGLETVSLHAAINHPDQLKKAIADAGPKEINTRDSDGDRYPLHWAAARGAQRCIELLVAAGADKAAVDAAGKTPAQLAQEMGEEAAFIFLTYGAPTPDPKQVESGFDGPSLNVALGQNAMLKHYLLGGGSPDVQDADGDRYPLHWYEMACASRPGVCRPPLSLSLAPRSHCTAVASTSRPRPRSPDFGPSCWPSRSALLVCAGLRRAACGGVRSF